MVKNVIVMLIIMVVMVRVLRKVERRVVSRQNRSDSRVFECMLSSRWENSRSSRFFMKQMLVIMNISSRSIGKLCCNFVQSVLGVVRLSSSVFSINRLFGCSGQYFSVMVRVKMNLLISIQVFVIGLVSYSSRGLSKRKVSIVSLYQCGECLRKFCVKVWFRGLFMMDFMVRKRLKMLVGFLLD